MIGREHCFAAALWLLLAASSSSCLVLCSTTIIISVCLPNKHAHIREIHICVYSQKTEYTTHRQQFKFVVEHHATLDM